MFCKKDWLWFGSGFGMCIAALVAFASDPSQNGLGVLSLWIAPIVFLMGLAAIFLGIVDKALWNYLKPKFGKENRTKYFGLIVSFICSFLIYAFTLEPTASLWDCSEFIAAAYKLQIPHTPGNPLLLVLGRLFSFISFNNPANVAWSINLMSAVFSALTVALLYLVTHSLISQNFYNKDALPTIASVCASLVLAFSDTFWFSAVEAETYAASSFFIMLMFWLILKGGELESQRRARLMILIFYVAGLSYCIHPMSLLALPLLPLVWRHNKTTLTFKSFIISLSLGIGIVLFINRFVAVGIFEVAFYFDLFLVNSFKLPLFSGAILIVCLLVVSYILLVKKLPTLQPYTYASLFLLVGFSSYIILFIRSNYNLPIDEGNPQNLSLIKAYMNREGYPTRPLLVGPYFDAEVTKATPVKKIYYETNSGYEFAGSLSEYEYTPGRQTILPRIYSNDPTHVQTYRSWLGINQGDKPSFIDNVDFMLRYQLGHMYWRYMLFNFAGRTSDVQNSNWLKPWDPLHESNGVVESKARNQYYMIPFVLGLIGAFVLLRKNRRSFIYVLCLFCLTGAVLAIYLNSTPNEPRERDYIYVGSYIAFAIFIGVGMMALLERVKNKYFIICGCIFSCALPAWMLMQNFDDHNRSGRTLQIDNARNILASCEKNSILFTGGDNDTFPLWYLQEVEEFRTDVRVVVLSYLNTDWYINQLRLPINQSPAFNLTLSKRAYRQYGPNDVIYVQEQLDNPIDTRKFLSLLNSEHPALTVTTESDDSYNVIPSHNLFIDSSSFKATKKSPMEKSRFDFRVKENYLAKNTLAILDLLTNNPDRPFHFNFTSITQTGLNLDEYMVQKGQVLQLDLTHHSSKVIPLDTDSSFKYLVENFNFHNLPDHDVYFNYEDHEARIIQPLRSSYNALAAELLKEGQTTKAEIVMDKAIRFLFNDTLRPSFANIQTADILVKLNREKEAERIAASLYEFCYVQNENNGDEINSQLLYWSAEMLGEMGKPEYLARMNNNRSH